MYVLYTVNNVVRGMGMLHRTSDYCIPVRYNHRNGKNGDRGAALNVSGNCSLLKKERCRLSQTSSITKYNSKL